MTNIIPLRGHKPEPEPEPKTDNTAQTLRRMADQIHALTQAAVEIRDTELSVLLGCIELSIEDRLKELGTAE